LYDGNIGFRNCFDYSSVGLALTACGYEVSGDWVGAAHLVKTKCAGGAVACGVSLFDRDDPKDKSGFIQFDISSLPSSGVFTLRIGSIIEGRSFVVHGSNKRGERGHDILYKGFQISDSLELPVIGFYNYISVSGNVWALNAGIKCINPVVPTISPGPAPCVETSLTMSSYSDVEALCYLYEFSKANHQYSTMCGYEKVHEDSYVPDSLFIRPCRGDTSECGALLSDHQSLSAKSGFIQFDVTSLPHSGAFTLHIGSNTNQEDFVVYGSNKRGELGTDVLHEGCEISDTLILPILGSYDFVSVSANVWIQNIGLTCSHSSFPAATPSSKPSKSPVSKTSKSPVSKTSKSPVSKNSKSPVSKPVESPDESPDSSSPILVPSLEPIHSHPSKHQCVEDSVHFDGDKDNGTPLGPCVAFSFHSKLKSTVACLYTMSGVNNRVSPTNLIVSSNGLNLLMSNSELNKQSFLQLNSSSFDGFCEFLFKFGSNQDDIHLSIFKSDSAGNVGDELLVSRNISSGSTIVSLTNLEGVNFISLIGVGSSGAQLVLEDVSIQPTSEAGNANNANADVSSSTMPVYAIVAIVVGCIGFLMLVGAWLFYARRRHTDKLKNLEDWINTGDGN